MTGSTNGNGKKPKVNLDAILDDAGTVVIRGTDYRVMQLDGPGWKVYDRIRQNVERLVKGESVPDEVSTDEFYGLAERVIPDAPSQVIWGLTTQRVGVVLHMAAQALMTVEENGPPNAEGPTTEEPPPSPSSA